MDILKTALMIVAIFVLLWIGVKLLINSQEKANIANKTYREGIKQIKETNLQLDSLLNDLKQANEPLEKVSNVFKKLNRKMFKK